MDARWAGYGFPIPMPRFPPSHLGKLMFFDEQGVARTMGKLSEDTYFTSLLEDFQPGAEFTSTSVQHPARTVAFTTGCIEVKPLTQQEVCKFIIQATPVTDL